MAQPVSLAFRISANLADLRANLQEAKAQLETTKQAMQRMANSFDGSKIIADSNAMVKAIHDIGGASKLTESEQRRVNATLQEALAKYRALGREAPAGLRELHDETANVNRAGTDWMGTLKGVAAAAGVAFSVSAIKNWVAGTIDAASRIDDLTRKLGVSHEALQRWTYAGEQNGITIEQINTAVSFMNKALSEGESSTVASLRKVGLQIADLRAMKPEDAFNTLVETIEQIEDPMLRAEIAMRLFSRSGQDLLPAIMEGFRETGDAAAVMSRETIQGLDAAGDAWTELMNRATFVSGTVIAAVFKVQDMVRDALRQTGSFQYDTGPAPKLPRAPMLPTMGGFRGSQESPEDAFKRMTDELKKWNSEVEKGEEAARKAADALKKELDAMTGLAAIKAADHQLSLVARAQKERNISLAQMSTAEQKKINAVVTEAIQAYRRLGKEAPQDMLAVWRATADLSYLNARVPEDLKAVEQAYKTLPQTAIPTLRELGVIALEATKPFEQRGHDIVKLFQKTAEETEKAIERGKEAAKKAADETRAKWHSVGDKFGDVATILDSMPGKLFEVAAMAARAGKAIADNLADGDVWGAVIAGATAAIGIIGKLFGFGPTDYEKRVRANNEAVKTLTADAIKAAGGMDKLRERAAIVGIQIDEAFRSRDAKWIEEVLGDVEERTQRLQAAMEKYGITWEELGPRARQAKINELAEELILDFEVLLSAGADVDLIIEKMGDSILEFVEMAQRTGTEVPLAMRPMLEKMLEMGLITDENGDAFESLEDAGITFAESFGAAADRIVDAIDRIAAALGYVFDNYDGRTINIGASYTPGTPPDSGRGRDPEIHAATGFEGWVHRQTRFTVAEGNRPEYVSVTPGGQAGGGMIEATFVLPVTGEVISRQQVAYRRRLRFQ